MVKAEIQKKIRNFKLNKIITHEHLETSLNYTWWWLHVAQMPII